MRPSIRCPLATLARCVAAAVATLPFAAAQAQSTVPADKSGSDWRYALSVYGYFPSLSGASSTPTSPGGPTIDVSAGNVVDALKFTFMGSFGANNGRYGFFTDLIYLDLGGSKQGYRDFTINQAPISGNTSANVDWDLKGVLWTLGGEYRVSDDPRLNLNLLAGTRMFSLKPRLRWNIQGDLGPIGEASRSGESESSEVLWDAIVGAKGRYALGDSGRWSMPFYVDVGAGQSQLTWQAGVGLSYAYSWGEITGMWRYVSYDMKSGSSVEDLRFSGPMIGATWRW
ncbi:MAG: hypothetical protein JSS56_19405 [Proteobacteria bacterium]|nr:hypothetical protein [Pseudomonadota bacterium]